MDTILMPPVEALAGGLSTASDISTANDISTASLVPLDLDEPERESPVPGLFQDASGRNFRIHPIAGLLPALSDPEFQALKVSIRESAGLVEPIVVSPDGNVYTVLDGRHRLFACLELGIVPETRECPGDALDLVLALNVHRRQLLPQQREMLAARLVDSKPGRPAKNGQIRRFTLEQACMRLNVGQTQVKAAQHLLENGVPELIALVDSGELRVGPASEVARRLDGEEQTRLARLGAGDVKEGAAKLRAARKLKKAEASGAKPTTHEAGSSMLDTAEAGESVEDQEDLDPDVEIADEDPDSFAEESSDTIDTDLVPIDDNPGCLLDEAAPIDGGTAPEDDEDDSRPIGEEATIGAEAVDPRALPLHKRLGDPKRFEREVRFWVQLRQRLDGLRLLTDGLLDNDPEFAKCAMAPGSLVRLAVSLASVPHPSLWAECSLCEGTGKKDDTSCSVCAGGGYCCSAT